MVASAAPHLMLLLRMPRAHNSPAVVSVADHQVRAYWRRSILPLVIRSHNVDPSADHLVLHPFLIFFVLHAFVGASARPWHKAGEQAVGHCALHRLSEFLKVGEWFIRWNGIRRSSAHHRGQVVVAAGRPGWGRPHWSLAPHFLILFAVLCPGIFEIRISLLSRESTAASVRLSSSQRLSHLETRGSCSFVCKLFHVFTTIGRVRFVLTHGPPAQAFEACGRVAHHTRWAQRLARWLTTYPTPPDFGFYRLLPKASTSVSLPSHAPRGSSA